MDFEEQSSLLGGSHFRSETGRTCLTKTKSWHFDWKLDSFQPVYSRGMACQRRAANANMLEKQSSFVEK
jgi:hypothetical protein